MLLVVDNGSVYTKNLIEHLAKTKINHTNLPYNQIDFSKIYDYDSFILSGRRKNNKEMNALNSKIIRYAISNQKKLLGICYGAEILALTLGGTIRKSDFIKGEQEIIIIKANSLCEGKLRIFESHNYEISNLNENLIGIAESENCKYEIIKHSDLNIYGTQFHPEMTIDGKKIIDTFISL